MARFALLVCMVAMVAAEGSYRSYRNHPRIKRQVDGKSKVWLHPKTAGFFQLFFFSFFFSQNSRLFAFKFNFLFKRFLIVRRKNSERINELFTMVDIHNKKAGRFGYWLFFLQKKEKPAVLGIDFFFVQKKKKSRLFWVAPQSLVKNRIFATIFTSIFFPNFKLIVLKLWIFYLWIVYFCVWLHVF